MKKEFWHERWALDEIGFHKKDLNPFLLEHWPSLNASENDSIFVPLCGKSLDLLWLSQQCRKVVGIELSQKAVEDFFASNGMTPEIIQSEHFSLYQAENIHIFCGDIFQLEQVDIADCTLIYDRASLVAFPPEMRKLYVKKLDELFSFPHKRLLITFDYDQQLMNGPPFAVSPSEVSDLLDSHYRIKRLESASIIEQNQRFKERGLSSLFEHVFVIEKR